MSVNGEIVLMIINADTVTPLIDLYFALLDCMPNSTRTRIT